MIPLIVSRFEEAEAFKIQYQVLSNSTTRLLPTAYYYYYLPRRVIGNTRY